jgi:hypothetical protein
MTATVSVTLLVKRFVDMYVKNKQVAVDWAMKCVRPALYPLMKPQIREELLKRGWKVKQEETPNDSA